MISTIGILYDEATKIPSFRKRKCIIELDLEFGYFRPKGILNCMSKIKVYAAIVLYSWLNNENKVDWKVSNPFKSILSSRQNEEVLLQYIECIVRYIESLRNISICYQIELDYESIIKQAPRLMFVT